LYIGRGKIERKKMGGKTKEIKNLVVKLRNSKREMSNSFQQIKERNQKIKKRWECKSSRGPICHMMGTNVCILVDVSS
jgi:hypothetical protein